MINHLKLIDKILFLLIFVGAVLSSYISWERYHIEQNATTVEMVYDYNHIVESASIENTSEKALFSLYKKSGITSLAVYDETPEKLINLGLVLAYRGSDFILKDSTNPEIKSDRIYIQASTDEDKLPYFNELKQHIIYLMRPEDVRLLSIDGKETIEIKADYERFLKMPLGIFSTTVSKVANQGFYVVLRPVNVPHGDKKIIDLFFDTVDSSDKISAVLFQGKSVLGYKDELEYVERELKKRNLPVVLIEAQNQLGFERQDGIIPLIEKVNYNAIRLYAMSKDELIKLDPKEAASRFYISTIERNIRMNLFPSYKFAANGETLSETNAKYISDVKSRLEDHGFKIGKASVMENYFPNKILKAIISLGAVSLITLVLIFLIPYLNAHLWKIEIAAILLTQGLYWCGKELFVLQSLALSAAICTPVIVITLFIKYCILRKKDTYSQRGYIQLFFESITLLWAGGILSLAGALYISGLLSDTRFFLEMDIFRGVKLTFVLPLILVSLIYIQHFPFFNQVVSSDKDFVQFIKKFCTVDIKLGILAVLGLLSIIGFVFVGRSGNNGAPVPQFEIALRRFLESVMYARPREKEFLFGHPAILFSLTALYHKWPQIFHYLFIMAITIGQGSIVETFAHMRSPFILSFMRGIGGLALGSVTLMIALIGIIILTHITKYFGERYGK